MTLLNQKFPFTKVYTTKDTKGQKNILVTDNCMKRMTFMKNHSNVLGIFSIPEKKNPPLNEKTLVLDNVSDQVIWVL